jgi:hypothetical protein
MRVALVLGVAAVLGLGCGYQFVRYADALGDARRIAISGFRNDSFEPGVDSLLTDAFVREFLRRGALEVVDDPAAADLVVSGVVRDVAINRRSFSSVAFALEYEVRLRVQVAVTRSDGTKLQVDESLLNESERYLASADVEVARTHRQEALRRLSGVLASRVHDALFERASP